MERKKLNVVAAAKGLVCGRMRIWYKTGDVTECWNDQDVVPLPTKIHSRSNNNQGILIPSINLIDRFDILDAEWVLVIEKEVLYNRNLDLGEI